jgi:hypothetical protein
VENATYIAKAARLTSSVEEPHACVPWLELPDGLGHEVLVSPDEDDTVDCHSTHGNVCVPGGHRTLGHASDAREERCRK